MQRSEIITRKRVDFRNKYSSFLYNPLINTTLVILTFSVSLLYSGSKINWNLTAVLILPFAFLYGEAVQYLTHKYQQHRKIRFHQRIFEMHSVWHHGMFSNNKMNVDSFKDINMVILPFFIHVFVIGLIYFPLGLLIDMYFLSDFGWLVMFAITLQLIWYEIVHTLSHLDNPPVLKSLARHHKEHHNPKLMGKYNFGISTTIFDRVFGTRYPGS